MSLIVFAVTTYTFVFGKGLTRSRVFATRANKCEIRYDILFGSAMFE